MRNIRKMNGPNDGTRTLFESVMAPEVINALQDWKKNNSDTGMLIGGLAISYYVKPRYTSDVDILYLHDGDIPSEVTGFKKHWAHAFEHRKTGVEIEVLSSEYLKMPENIVQKIIDTSVETDGIKVASVAGLIVSKLFRYSYQDRADIAALIEYDPAADISGFGLDQDLVNRFITILSDSSHRLNSLDTEQ